MIELRKIYESWDKKYKLKVVQLNRNTTPVNFKESLQTPIHRWLAYKEGFSPNFVKSFINRYNKNKNSNSVVFDPFGGIGTTVLTSITLGFEAYSTDVNPLGNFAAKVKCHKYTNEEILDINKELILFKESSSIETLVSINNDTVKSYFYAETFDALIKARSHFNTINSPITKDLFTLALLSIVESISTHRKDGNGLKKKKRLPEPVNYESLKYLVSEKIESFLHDIEQTDRNIYGKSKIFDQSCIEPYTLPSKADIVITSPPYANCFDYSKVYMNELWVGGFFDSKSDQQKFREISVSSHVHYKWKRFDREFSSHFIEDKIIPKLKEKDLWNKSILSMLPEYFADLGRCLYYISENLNDDATVGFVVGNSVYAGVVVPTDLILADIAEKLGYSVEGIEVYRRLSSSSQQMAKLAEEDKVYLRESLVILKWHKIK